MENENDKPIDNKSEKQSNNTASYLLTFAGGAAVGLAIGYYLNSSQGKQLRERIAERVKTLESDLEEKVESTLKEIKAGLKTDAAKETEDTVSESKTTK